MVVRSQLNGSMTFGPPAFILVGGAMDEPRLSHMANFTGDMSSKYYVCLCPKYIHIMYCTCVHLNAHIR